MLDARVVVTRPGMTVDVPVRARPGDVLAVLGPNGSGKTTTLRAIAGLERLVDGHVRVGEEVWDDPVRGVARTSPARRVGMVFQEHLLFPHLSVRENVAFGPRSRGVPRGAARRAADVWLDRLGLAELADRKPRQLSGGQAQRVALTRALATDPQVMLLDEPLSALDAGARMEMRGMLQRQLREFGGVSLLVTHDALDALVIADRLVVLHDGRVAQTGTPDEVARRPRSAHVAHLVGLNLLHGSAREGILTVDGGRALVVTAGHHDGRAFACFSPSAVALYAERPGGSPRNVWQGRVNSLMPHGDGVRVEIQGDVPLLADVTPQSVADLDLTPGTPIWSAVKATEVAVYPE